ncbi:SIS domain-containing protein, partial [Pelagibacteraceae bacterium]|nr:SIS domain-containing protein [Pelagibacteraceae bacterium]
LNSSILNGSIICHTRWASVGKVSNHNCHPVSNYKNDLSENPYVHAFVNGDIYNYKEITDKAKMSYNLNSRCTSDTIAVPYLFTDKNIILDKNFVNLKLNKLIGSYALALETSANTNKILISKYGSQGLYFGKSVDNNIMFSSDVYGLVENCRFYYSMPSDYFAILDKRNCNFPITLHSLNKRKVLNVKSTDLVESMITTRDISKMGYSHFLEKEIHETESILNRTCLSHIDINKLKKGKTDFFGSQFHNIDRQIIKKIKHDSFEEIIITGMGTCYTAAVVISRYMRKVLRYQNPKIIVQPHIASEGSAFYLKSNMKNTLVIVIAQSGTTIDTNVYVKLAKNRGAKTISIVNKRDGDVTFLVDSSIYLGNGRDIEMAVPSTKTFNAHVITGYMLTLFFYYNTANPNKSVLLKDMHKIIKSPILAKNSINKFKNIKINNHILESFLTKKNWFMLHDESEVSAVCQEVRIKLSECCYSSVPFHSLEYLKYHKIYNSVIIMMIGKRNSISLNEIRNISKNNCIYIISDKFKYRLKNVTVLNTPNTDTFFSFLPSVIYGQLLSYNIALKMDKRKTLIQELTNNKFGNHAKLNLQKALKNKIFTKGIEEKDLKIIKYLSRSKNNIKNQIKAKTIIDIIKRPIDTIKHQAKTITVGTQRIQETNDIGLSMFPEKDYSSTNNLFYYKELSLFLSNYSINIKKKNHIFFYSSDIDETILYFAINYLNNFCSKFS